MFLLHLIIDSKQNIKKIMQIIFKYLVKALKQK